MGWGAILSTGISFILGAGASWAISWIFYKRQLKDQQERDEIVYQEKIAEQQARFLNDEMQRQEREYRAQRERLYNKRLAKFQAYDPEKSGWKISYKRGSVDQITIRNTSNNEYFMVTFKKPEPGDDGWANDEFARMGEFKPGAQVTFPVSGSINELAHIFIEGYKSQAGYPTQTEVPLDPNMTMSEYRESE